MSSKSSASKLMVVLLFVAILPVFDDLLKDAFMMVLWGMGVSTPMVGRRYQVPFNNSAM
jgi:hypothetical protein